MSRPVEEPRCAHGGARWGSCPEDRLAQMRVRWGGGVDPRGPEEEWQTHSGFACDANWKAWSSQVAPVLRKRGYETRVIRVADEVCPA